MEKDNSVADSDTDQGRINPVVFYGSGIGIIIFALCTILFTDTAVGWINMVLGWISNSFGWFYFIAVVAYLLFVIVIAMSRFGTIRLGREHMRPEFPLLTWAAMLFAAGIGIDLLFFCVAEPVTQFLAPPVGEGGTEAAARHALELTYLHWGLSGWGVYSLVGMSLAFFSYRHGLPLAIRSALYPIFGKRIYGPIGHAVDIAAVLGTIFGVATSLGIGIIQLNFGLNFVFGLPSGVLTQVSLAVVIVVFSAISAVTGVEKGIRRLSEFNMLLAALLMFFVLVSGQTVFLLNALVTNIGDYLSGFVKLSLNTYAFNPPSDWLNSWTVFFWAWWIAWGPFVGLFLARISRGRTIREFVAGTLLLPMGFMMAWMSIMGNSAIDLVMNGAEEFGRQAMDSPGSSIYLFLQSFPWTGLTTIVASILAIVFFVTSGDSGSLVLSNLSSHLKDPSHDAPAWMRVLWAGVIGVLTIALLLADGLTALQSAVVIMGLPFAFVLFMMMYGLTEALRVEGIKEDSYQDSLSAYLSSRISRGDGGAQGWSQRLARMMKFPDREEAHRFLDDIAKPAMEEIIELLDKNGYQVELVEGSSGNEHLELNVDLEDEQGFSYQLWPRKCVMPVYTVRTQEADAHYYRVEVHLFEGGQGIDLMGYTKDQVIQDVLDQFERHLHFLHMQRDQGSVAIMPDQETTAPQ